jgi:hypothetical protein
MKHLLLAGVALVCLAAPSFAQTFDIASTPGVLSALAGTVTAVSTSSVRLTTLSCYNTNASASYVQLFAASTANVTLGTTAPNFVLSLPASQSVTFNMYPGIGFNGALSAAATTTATGSTGVSTGVVCGYSTGIP